MNISRLLAGGFAVILGIYLLWIAFVEEPFWIWIYGITILGIGIFILFNSKEDKIEKMKKNNEETMRAKKNEIIM